MIYNFVDFINESNKEKLKYYIFDWDDNILVMPTIIHMQENINNNWVDKDVSTLEFSKIRTEKNWRLKNNDPKQAYSEFSDLGERGDNAFLNDTIESIKNKKFGPMWIKFINCLVEGNLFMIVTSRSHKPNSIRKAIEWIIYNYLSTDKQNAMIINLMTFHDLFSVDIDYVIEQYLDNCEFFGVGDPINQELKDKSVFKEIDSVETRKNKSIKYFKSKIIPYGDIAKMDIKLGYSEDDNKILTNVIDMLNKEKELDFMVYKNKRNSSRIEYYVDDTSDPKNVNTIVI